MTVTVETPDGIVTGSSVIEVNATYCSDGCGLAGDIEVGYGYRGEVVAVEILPGQWLFTLFGREAERMYRASPDQFSGIPLRDRGAWLAATPRRTGPVELTGGFRPRFVTFEDIDDPTTVAVVDPNNMVATFGEGVRLLNVTLEVVQEDVTTAHIDQILSWFADYEDLQLDGRRLRWADAEFPIANSLNRLDFWRQ